MMLDSEIIDFTSIGTIRQLLEVRASKGDEDKKGLKEVKKGKL
jgi:hypothetical protein